VKQSVLVIVAVAILAPVAAGAYVLGVLPGTAGCVLTSVDEREYVARNEALFRTISLPRYLREVYATTWTHGIPAHNKCLPPRTARHTAPSSPLTFTRGSGSALTRRS
jgi:hypothetical protein